MTKNILKAAGLVGALFLTACMPGVSGTSESGIPVGDLEQQIAIKLSSDNNRSVKLNAVTCYEGLAAVSGAQTRCSVVERGNMFWVTAISQGETEGAVNFTLQFDY